MSKLLPRVVTESLRMGAFIIGYQSWASYDLETNTISIMEGVKPRWLAILHEYGHWLIGYAPEWLHKRVSLDYEYDRLWNWLDLSRFISMTFKGE